MSQSATATSKRKSDESPEGQVAQQRLRRRGSLPELSNLAEQRGESRKSFSLLELFSKSFQDPQIVSDITPVIVEALQPGISAAVVAAVDSAVTRIIPQVVKDAVAVFRTEVMDPIIEEKDKKIEEFQKQIKEKDGQIANLAKEVKDLKFQHNELAQYGRRCNIRLNNVRLTDESQCEKKVVEVLNNILQTDQDSQVNGQSHKLTEEDIERCHPLGHPNKNGPLYCVA